MGRISKDEQRVLNEKAEEIKKIICNEKLSWNQLYPKIVKTIVVTFLELRLDSIFKRLDIPELPDEYMGKYYNRIDSEYRYNVEILDDYECDIARNWLRASFYNDNRFLDKAKYKSLQKKFTELKERLNRRIDDLKINLDYKTMLVNFNFPKSLQRKYARLGWFLSKKVLNDNFRRSLNLELRIGKTRLATSTLSTVRELEFGIHTNLFPEEIFPKNSIWSIFYLFKFDNEDDEIKNLLEFKQNRKLENLIAIRPIFEIKTKNESDSEIITLEDFLEKESVKIEDCQIEINEEYKDPNKTKYKKNYEVDYKDLMNIWYWECVKRNDLERALKLVLTSMKRNEIHYNSQDRSTADKPKKSTKKYKDPLPKYKDEPLKRWSDLNLIIDCEKENMEWKGIYYSLSPKLKLELTKSQINIFCEIYHNQYRSDDVSRKQKERFNNSLIGWFNFQNTDIKPITKNNEISFNYKFKKIPKYRKDRVEKGEDLIDAIDNMDEINFFF